MSAAAVVLAAGASARLGRPKQLLEIEGETLVRRTARLCMVAGFRPLVVVLGCAAEETSRALDGLGIVEVFNADWAEGMAASIRAGIGALPAAATAALIAPCDQPALSVDLVDGFLRGHAARPEATFASEYAGGLGVPALFPRRRFRELLALTGDRGAKALLGDAVAIPFPEGGLDLDTPEDVEDWLGRGRFRR